MILDTHNVNLRLSSDNNKLWNEIEELKRIIRSLSVDIHNIRYK